MRRFGVFSSEVKTVLKLAWRKPLRTPRALVCLLFHLNAQAARRNPTGSRARLIRKLYPYAHGDRKRLSRAPGQLRRATHVAFRGLAGRTSAVKRGVALVPLLRNHGAWLMHGYHSYLVACALKRQGYRVVLVRCRGETENCGSGIEGKLRDAPPYVCRECHALSASFHDDGFEVVYLDDYADQNENAIINDQPIGPGRPVEALALGDIPYGKLALPFLLRYFKGDRSRIDLGNPEVTHHLKGALRLALRYERLIAEMRPSCAVLFNGLFIPERLFGDTNRRNAVLSLYTERGPRRDSLFISDEPAPHYRLDAVWESEKGRIGAQQVETASKYVQGRRQRNLDPSGRPRPIQVDDIEKYEELADVPYTVFFPAIFYDTVSMEKESCFKDIFDAIDQLCLEAQRQQARLVIRCHPDEAEAGGGCYSVRQFLRDRQFIPSEHIICLDSAEQWNAYLLAEKARSVVIYNGSLGMELPALGRKIFNLARSHYTERGFTREIHNSRDLADIFCEQESTLLPAEHEIALKYFWFYYFHASVDLSSLLSEYEPFRLDFSGVEDNAETRQALEAIDERVAFLLRHTQPATPRAA